MTHMFLAGFMGAGKSTVGRLLAERLGCPFFDCDVEVEDVAGRTIEEMFAREGEQSFRELESRVLASIVERESSVVALGGGALSSAANVELLKRAGPIICLSAEPAAIYRRVGRQSGRRPLLNVAEPLSKIRELLESREACYAQADVSVDTTDLGPADVADRVLDWLNRVRVNLGDRSYDISIEPGCAARIGPFLAQLPEAVSSAAIITSRQIDRRYGDAVRASLADAGLPRHTLLVPAGESYKTLETAARSYGDLIQRKIDRKAAVIALGGGVIGDLAGFVAATYQRGIRFVQAPTTLMAQVDSSVGGKVGVNHPLGKNMIGAFLQPLMVAADPLALSTLPPRELRSGLAEVVKYGVIWDQAFFSLLEANAQDILRLEPQTMRHIIRTSCQIKARVVELDERESGLRAILNYGHTFAHAVETCTGYQRYTHGEAVAMGMAVAARLACALGMLRAEAANRIIRLLERLGLPTRLPKADPDALLSVMETDKKAVAGTVRFVLPTEIGRVEVAGGVPRDLLLLALQESAGE